MHKEKTGMQSLCLGVIILLISILPWASCRPLDGDYAKLTNFDHAYRRITEKAQNNSFSEGQGVSEQNFAFEKISRDEKPTLNNVELVKAADNEGIENPLLNNGSMIVHVIVTSSSSSSSSSSSEVNDEIETDSHSDTAAVPEKDMKRVKDEHKAEMTPPLPFHSSQFNLEQSSKPSQSQTEMGDKVELKRLPKSALNESRYPPDIFSAFYRAFSQNPSSSSTLGTVDNDGDFFSLPSFYSHTTDKPLTTFSVKPQLRSNPHHNLFLYQQRRRRLFRNRQLEERKTFSLPPGLDQRMLADAPTAPTPGRKEDVLQETAEKLEQLVKKLDEIEVERISPSPSSLKEATVRPSTKFQLSPSKIAVSVAVTKSESIAHPGPRRPNRQNGEVGSKAVEAPSMSSSYQRRTYKPKAKILEDQTEKQNESKVDDSRFDIQDRANVINFSGDIIKNDPDSDSATDDDLPEPSRRKITRTVASEIGDPSQQFFNLNLKTPNGQKVNAPLPTMPSITSQSTHPNQKVPSWQEPSKVWGEPAQVWGVPAKVWGEPEKVWGEPAKVWSEQFNNAPWKPKRRRVVLSTGGADDDNDEMMQSDQPPEERDKTTEKEDSPQGTFVILGDDENEGDSIDGDLGRPLMLHHFTIPPSPAQPQLSSQPPSASNSKTVSVSTSVSSSVSSTNKNFSHFARPPTPEDSNDSLLGSSSNTNSNYDRLNNSSDPSSKKSGKKFGYVIEGANVRKYRVEERTPDGYIVGEYGVLNNQNAFLRGVRYTADGTINPRLIHEALMKFLSLRR